MREGVADHQRSVRECGYTKTFVNSFTIYSKTDWLTTGGADKAGRGLFVHIAQKKSSIRLSATLGFTKSV